jgi:hypothetical protein
VAPSGDGGGGLTTTGQICGSCGAQSSPTAKFCGECGARLTEAPRSAEYKQVTVLFADVVHSMDIAAAVGAERLREIMTELVNRSTTVVHPKARVEQVCSLVDGAEAAYEVRSDVVGLKSPRWQPSDSAPTQCPFFPAICNLHVVLLG